MAPDFSTMSSVGQGKTYRWFSKAFWILTCISGCVKTCMLSFTVKIGLLVILVRHRERLFASRAFCISPKTQ